MKRTRIINVPNRTGHDAITVDLDAEEAVAAAEELLAGLRKEGRLLYARREDGSHEQIDGFDPTAVEIHATPALVGG